MLNLTAAALAIAVATALRTLGSPINSTQSGWGSLFHLFFR